jgi:pimeloyl-ACP methyl ester carboxylesterase
MTLWNELAGLDYTVRHVTIGPWSTTLVIWTSDDPSGPAKAGLDMTKRVRAGEFRLIEHAGHWPQWEQRDEFDAVVLEFLGRRE